MPPRPKECEYVGIKGWYRYDAELYHLCKRNQQMSPVSEIEIEGNRFGGHQCNSCETKIEWQYSVVDGVYPVIVEII